LTYDRQAVGQSLLVSGQHLRPATNFSFTSMEIILRQCGVCYYGAGSLTRGQVCNLQLMLGLASADFLGHESRWTYRHILLSLYSDSPNLVDQVPVFIYRRNWMAQLHPRNWVPLLSHYKTEFLLSNIKESNSYLRESTLLLRYRANPVNAVWGRSRCLL
jgi:hypothetical protein